MLLTRIRVPLARSSAGVDRPHGGAGPDGHERRGVDAALPESELPAPRGAGSGDDPKAVAPHGAADLRARGRGGANRGRSGTIQAARSGRNIASP